MITSTRPIPKIGTALLVLGGCYSAKIGEPATGGGGGGAGGGGGGDGDPSVPEMIALSYCEHLEACDPAYVGYAFGTVAECTDVVGYELEYWADDYAVTYGAACGEAFLDYYECFVGAITGCGSYYLFTYDYAAAAECADAFALACPGAPPPI